MKISLDWLRDYVDTSLSADEIGDILSNLGFPIESVEQVGDDTMLDVEVTSNRGDCLGHIGIARELAAATGQELKIPVIDLTESDKEAQSMVQVKIDEPDLLKVTGMRIRIHQIYLERPLTVDSFGLYQ